MSRSVTTTQFTSVAPSFRTLRLSGSDEKQAIEPNAPLLYRALTVDRGETDVRAAAVSGEGGERRGGGEKRGGLM